MYAPLHLSHARRSCPSMLGPDIYRALMRTVSTASTSTVEVSIQINHLRFNSRQGSMSPASTREQERYHEPNLPHEIEVADWHRSTPRSSRVCPTGSAITPWRPYSSNCGGEYLSPSWDTGLTWDRYMALPQHKKLPQPQEGTTF